jgi:hypothetical protein
MGAHFNTAIINSIDTIQIKKEFKAIQEQDLHENGHSYSGGFGMANGLEFRNESFENMVKADNWLLENAEKWDAALAVQFKDKNGKLKTLIGAWCAS